jgi:hypothetical protein
MGTNEILIIIRLVTGAFCTFSAILLWSRTREASWIFIIIGTICIYMQIVAKTLEEFGVFDTGFLVFGIPIIKLLIDNLPLIFLSIGFLVAAKAKSKY